MAVVFTLLAAGNVENRIQYNVTMAASDPEVTRDVFADLVAGQTDFAKVLGDVMADDAAARVRLGLRQAADAATADDGRLRVTVTPNTAGLMPQVIAKKHGTSGRAALAITAAGAGAATQVLVTITLERENMRQDGSAI